MTASIPFTKPIPTGSCLSLCAARTKLRSWPVNIPRSGSFTVTWTRPTSSRKKLRMRTLFTVRVPLMIRNETEANNHRLRGLRPRRLSRGHRQRRQPPHSPKPRLVDSHLRHRHPNRRRLKYQHLGYRALQGVQRLGRRLRTPQPPRRRLTSQRRQDRHRSKQEQPRQHQDGYRLPTHDLRPRPWTR